MKNKLSSLFGSYRLRGEENRGIDWILFLATLPLLGAGLITMNSFVGDGNFFTRQLSWIIVALLLFFALSFVDFRFLRKTWVSVSLFAGSCALLLSLFAVGKVAKGALSWFDFGLFSFQPSDPIKLVIIIILAKYFSRRHIEIAHVRHIIISGFYAFVIFALVLVQPDFGSAIIIFFIWLGMILVSGLSKRHLLGMFVLGLVAFAGLWNFGFQDYQKNRIKNFINPLADIRGTGYNAYQSTIAVGSGELWGKGVGYGTQSRLKFLPEYQTDFIFAAFAEEWGFFGVIILFGLFGVVVWRIVLIAMHGDTNFEILFGAGVATLIIVHFFINVGMNIQLLPVTGTTLPFLSYGGTHLLTEFAGLGILMGMRRYRRTAHKDSTQNEFIGPQ
ncbi:MAG: FtsW/RodA/SpoVE family cell cycle protein [Patescibacteria group bacterium]